MPDDPGKTLPTGESLSSPPYTLTFSFWYACDPEKFEMVGDPAQLKSASPLTAFM